MPNVPIGKFNIGFYLGYNLYLFLVRYFTRTFIICTASNILIVNFCIPLRLWIINTSGLGVNTQLLL